MLWRTVVRRISLGMILIPPSMRVRRSSAVVCPGGLSVERMGALVIVSR